MMHSSNQARAGLTLVEMLAMVGIIGLGIGLLLPAVQARRESARRQHCADNVRRLAEACLQHEAAQRFLPSGGWGWAWCGDPDRGYGRSQSGSWLYSILPYLDQRSLHDTGLGTTGTAKRAAIAALAGTPVATFYCPSRRPPVAYPDTWTSWWRGGYVDHTAPALVAKTDYAANAGAGIFSADLPIPMSVAEADGGTFGWARTDDPSLGSYCSGVIYYRSQLELAMVRDGLSNVYLLGEKFLQTDQYTSSIDRGDNQNAFVGFEGDNHRVTNPAWPPKQDLPGVEDKRCFGSAHALGYSAAFCDGSVRTVSYTINPETHRRLGNREDRQPVDQTDL
jgi:type II secretory pathway pseudopilin PulG